jgi:hypothetical protein
MDRLEVPPSRAKVLGHMSKRFGKHYVIGAPSRFNFSFVASAM